MSVDYSFQSMSIQGAVFGICLLIIIVTVGLFITKKIVEWMFQIKTIVAMLNRQRQEAEKTNAMLVNMERQIERLSIAYWEETEKKAEDEQ